MDALLERIAQKLRVQMGRTSSTDDSITLVGPLLANYRTALGHFQVSRPTFKVLRERSEVEFMQAGRAYRYNICA